MSRRRPRHVMGRNSLLTPERHKQLIDLTRGGVPAEVAAPNCGITSRSLYRWAARGLREEERILDAEQRIEDGEPPIPVEVDPEIEAPYRALWRDLDAARSAAAIRNVVSMQKVVVGGQVTREVTRKFRDPVDGRIVEETTREYAQPDWRAAAWFLERQQRGQFGKPSEQVEVSGPQGGPVELGVQAAESLAERLAATIAQRREGERQALALTAGDGDVVDAEVVV